MTQTDNFTKPTNEFNTLRAPIMYICSHSQTFHLSCFPILMHCMCRRHRNRTNTPCWTYSVFLLSGARLGFTGVHDDVGKGCEKRIGSHGDICISSLTKPCILFLPGITCWRTDPITSMGWCATPVRMHRTTPKNVRPALSLISRLLWSLCQSLIVLSIKLNRKFSQTNYRT